MDVLHIDIAMLMEAAGTGLWLFIKATMLVALAWLATKMMSRTSAAIRHGVWSIALVFVVLLPILSFSLPPWRVEILPRSWADNLETFLGTRTALAPPRGGDVHASESSSAEHGIVLPLQTDTRDAASMRSQSTSNSSAWRPDWFFMVAILLGVWLAGSLALLGRLGVHVWRVHRCRKFNNFPCSRIDELVSGLLLEMGLKKQVRVVCGDHIDVPAISGSFRPMLLLPVEALDWTEERLHVVLMHELAHVRRHDYLIQLLTELTVSLYWPNPLLWMARRNIYFEQERAADDVVLRAGTPSLTYAEHLYDVARAFQHRQNALRQAVSMAGRADFKERVQAILDGKVNRRPLTRVAGLGFSVFLVMISLPLSTLHLDESGSDISRKTARDTSHAPIYLWIEAENAHLQAPFQQDIDERASGGTYILFPGKEEREGRGKAIFQFEVEHPGRYTIWGRVRALEDDRNSFFVKLDQRDEIIWDTPRRDRTARYWMWTPVRARGRQTNHAPDLAFDLEPGVHSLEIRNREAGTMLDGILITDDSTYRPRGTSPARPPAIPVYVWLEAEQAPLQRPFEVRSDASASAGQYIVAKDESSKKYPPESGRAIYQFEAPVAGVYTVWGRLLVPDDNDDSFWVRMNEGPWIEWDDIDAEKRWRWNEIHDDDYGDEVVQFELERGANRLEIAYREEDVRLDRLLITNDPMADPSVNASVVSNPEAYVNTD